MTESEEEAYLCGQRQVWTRMLTQCLRELGYDSEESTRVQWVIEREQAIATLRQVCANYGDNQWPENLHLGDIIEKHLWRNLKEKSRG